MCYAKKPAGEAPHQPKHHQLHITEDLTSDELCEPSHNSSTANTAAATGGLMYRPTRLRTSPPGRGRETPSSCPASRV